VLPIPGFAVHRRSAFAVLEFVVFAANLVVDRGDVNEGKNLRDKGQTQQKTAGVLAKGPQPACAHGRRARSGKKTIHGIATCVKVAGRETPDSRARRVRARSAIAGTQ
jgi:hypothetical protein